MRIAYFVLLCALINIPDSALGAPLQLVAKVPIPDSKGRIDHLAFAPLYRRLYVAELGNNSVAVIDVDKRRLLARITGLDEPQGIAYYPPLDRVYIASGGDGGIHVYDANTLKPFASLKLGEDADNVRIDPSAKRLYVGYGNGALAVLDPATLQRLADVPLKGHPESFQLSASDARILVNVPDRNEIAVVDGTTHRQVASWPASRWRSNYPMALDEGDESALSVFRLPARIVRYSLKNGAIVTTMATCGDADDVFVDTRRDRVYVICGEGLVDTLDRKTLARIDRFATNPGARTGLYSADADLLFVAARAQGANEAAVWVLKPQD